VAHQTVCDVDQTETEFPVADPPDWESLTGPRCLGATVCAAGAAVVGVGVVDDGCEDDEP
jgi:hypothetical protein